MIRKFQMIFIILLMLLGCTPSMENASMQSNNAFLCEHKWKQIIPGVTSKKDALLFLESQPYISEIKEFKVQENVERVSWKQPGIIPSHQTGMILVVDGIVQAIRVPLDYKLNINEFINRCGPPEFIRAVKDGESPFVWIELLNTQKGISAIGRAEYSSHESFIIPREAIIVGIEYFTPTSIEDYLRGVRLINDNDVLQDIREEFQDWPGVGGEAKVFFY